MSEEMAQGGGRQGDNSGQKQGITTLVLDIGGIVLDDTDETLWKVVGIEGAENEELRTKLEYILYKDERWGDAMRGNLAKREYLAALKRENPELERELEIAFGWDNIKKVLPIDWRNVEFLKKLHQEGNYKMYWLSNMDDDEYEYLTREGILEMLDGGAYSCIEHCKKPEPEFYRCLFNRYNLNPGECVFFDDRERNLNAGRELGMRGVKVASLDDLIEVVEESL